MRLLRLFFLTLTLGFAAHIAGPLLAQPAPAAPVDAARLQRAEARVTELEQRFQRVQRVADQASSAVGIVSFLFGAFCALWAQNTGRSAWLWFFLGLFFSVLTVLVLLHKNSADIDQHRRAGRRPFNLEDFRRQ